MPQQSTSLLMKLALKLYKSYGSYNLYVLSFVLSILACLSLGILALFSIFVEPFITHLGYSQAIINNIIIFQTIGLNCFTPLSGYIADAKGIWILALTSLIGYFIGFSLVVIVYSTNWAHHFMYLSFFIIGCSHASFLFSCLLNSAKSLGRYYKTLAISTPNVMVAFSSFIQIQMLSTFFNDTENPVNNFLRILKFFLYSLCFSCGISFLACKLTDYVEYFEVEYEHSEVEEFSNFETSPLLTGAAVVLHSPQGSILGSPRSWYVEDSSAMNLDDELSMLSTSSNIVSGPMTYEKRIRNFLTDPLMYPILLCCLISIGATEFFIANMGSILKNLHSTQLDKYLQIFSVASTVTRLVIMLGTDSFCTYFEVSRLTVISLTVIACALSHIYLSSADISTLHFGIIVALNAALNSSIFTMFPAILASIYGIEILGTTWGLFSSASIVGNLLLNVTYSFDFTQNCVGTADDGLVICSTFTFFISGLSILGFGLLVLFLRGKYLERAKEFF